MASLRESELPSFLKSRFGSAAGLLVYGSDEAGVAAVAGRVIQALAGSGEVRRFSAAALRADPALFDDAVRAMSLLGGRELVVVDDCDDSLAPAAASLSGLTGGNLALLIAGSLSKSSKLRKFFD